MAVRIVVIMAVVMVVAVKRKSALCAAAEDGAVFLGLSDNFGAALAADMTMVEALIHGGANVSLRCEAQWAYADVTAPSLKGILLSL